MNIRETLTQQVRLAMTAAGIPPELPANVATSTRPEFGDFQANGALAAAKRLKRKPRDLATDIVANLKLEGIADKIDIAGPGFINIHLSDDYLAASLNQSNPAAASAPQPVQTVVVDYSSPNLAKEMHVGHLRSTIIGDAIARVLEHLGHTVIRQNHMGDWGTQFGMLIAELEEQVGEGEVPELALSDLEGFYQQSKRHFDEDPAFADKARQYVVSLQSGDAHCLALWQQFIDISVAHSEALYRQLNVTLSHQHIRPESAYNDDLAQVLADLQAAGLACESEGAQVVFLDELADKNGKPSPVIVQKSDGGYLYATSDLAALRYRSQTLKADRALYFIDARQSLHMKQVFTVARKAGFVDEAMQLEHLPFGTMMGEDGKPFKTRSGGTVKLADLLVEALKRAEQLIAEKNPELDPAESKEIARKVGIGAVKYADLSKTRTNDYIFNWDAMLSFEGNTAPYLQYAYSRICSVFRKAELARGQIEGAIRITAPQEKTLALSLLSFDETLKTVAEDGYPHTLCTYLYDLASAFMSFYEHCPILRSDIDAGTRASRLQLSNTAADTLQKGLELLGIETMERM
ncbi:MAG: arginine--tRNA ligase [Gammaproteobacteria bacterium]|nr:arginine--tRNA ligase [Gammaproteobacteria bacterium]MBQ0840659.1 arginine--tRNA ligase [Gammaproteobacteria bacterium]